MTSLSVNAMLFIYVFAFCVGMIQITLNSLIITRIHSIAQSRILSFNIIFFFYLIINFLLFFCRQFAQLQIISGALIVIFDLLYALLIWAWSRYCFALIGKETGMLTKYLVPAVCMVYFFCWLITDMFFMADNQVDITLIGKILTTTGEVAILVMTIEIMWYSYIHIKGKKRYILCLDIVMTVYALYYFVYDMDCIFQFIGPRNWLGYPFDLLVPVYILLNAICIISNYADLWKRKSLCSEDTVEEVVKALDPEQNLTAREREVLILMIFGKTNNQIAEELVISIYTVKRHVNNIFKKTEVSSRAELETLLR